MQRSSTARSTANGMILTVATICLGWTGSRAASVAIVTASSIRFSRSIRARSRTTSPACSANRLTRPVNGLSTRRCAPAAASASRRAASSSCTSSGPSRAAMTEPTPAAASAATSSADSRRPLRKDELARLDRVGEDRALRLGQRQIAEPHAAGSRRSTFVISAITESATSAGLTAPIARPAGPWMRPSAGGSWPSAPRRSSLAAWVRLLPRAAM